MTAVRGILAIDPGTQCGWALTYYGKIAASGVWDLRANRYSGGGMRFVRFQNCLNEVAQAYRIEGVAYEEVRKHLGTDAAHVYGGIIGILTAWCETMEIPYQGIPVGTVKRVATGKGNANKAAMMEAARRYWPEAALTDENEVDARFIAVAAMDLFGNGEKTMNKRSGSDI